MVISGSYAATNGLKYNSFFGAYHFFCIAQICRKICQNNCVVFCVAQICEISGGKSRGGMCITLACIFWCKILLKHLRKNLRCKKNCKILRTKLHKNNHSANVCTIFCVNLCILKQFLQKFVQKSYGSFTLMLHDTFSPEFSVNCHITINCTDLLHAVRDVALAVQETNSVYCQ